MLTFLASRPVGQTRWYDSEPPEARRRGHIVAWWGSERWAMRSSPSDQGVGVKACRAVSMAPTWLFASRGLSWLLAARWILTVVNRVVLVYQLEIW